MGALFLCLRGQKEKAPRMGRFDVAGGALSVPEPRVILNYFPETPDVGLPLFCVNVHVRGVCFDGDEILGDFADLVVWSGVIHMFLFVMEHAVYGDCVLVCHIQGSDYRPPFFFT